MSDKAEAVFSGPWRIHFFCCCRLWREEMAWWSNCESNNQRWTDVGEKLLFWRTGVKLEGRNFTELQELLFCRPAEKSKDSSKTGFFLSFVYLAIPDGRKLSFRKQEQKHTWMQLECFDWSFSYLILGYPIAAHIITAEPVPFFNSNVSWTTFPHFPNFARIGSNPGGRLRIRCCQDVRTIPWKAPSWSQKLLCWLFFFGCPENPEKVLK